MAARHHRAGSRRVPHKPMLTVVAHKVAARPSLLPKAKEKILFYRAHTEAEVLTEREFSYNLPPVLLAEFTGSFTCSYSNNGIAQSSEEENAPVGYKPMTF